MPPPPVVMNRPYNPKPEKSDMPMLLMIGSICCLPICCPCALVYYIAEEDKYGAASPSLPGRMSNRTLPQLYLLHTLHVMLH